MTKVDVNTLKNYSSFYRLFYSLAAQNVGHSFVFESNVEASQCSTGQGNQDNKGKCRTYQIPRLIKHMDVRGYVFNIATFLDMQEMDCSSEEADTSIPPGCPRASKNDEGNWTIFRNCYFYTASTPRSCI